MALNKCTNPEIKWILCFSWDEHHLIKTLQVRCFPVEHKIHHLFLLLTTISKIFHRTFNKYMKATGSSLSTELGKSSSRPSTLLTTPEFNFKPEHELVNHILLFSWTGKKLFIYFPSNSQSKGNWRCCSFLGNEAKKTFQAETVFEH